MPMNFSYYSRPGIVSFLDDDVAYLQVLMDALPQDWFITSSTQPEALIEHLKPQAARSEADAWRHQEIVFRGRDGVSLIKQVLDYWREDATDRFDLVQVLVVDYGLPGTSGLRVLSELRDWIGARILLSGLANEHLAVTAFNRGLIEQYIPKQSIEVRNLLVEAIQVLKLLPLSRHQQAWHTTLTSKQQALIANPKVTETLQTIAHNHQWIEHVVMGNPFGVLALDNKGAVTWLQLETPEHLFELAQITRSQGHDVATVAGVQKGTHLIAFELQNSFDAEYKAPAMAAFAIDGLSEPLLYGAFTAIPERFCPGPLRSYEMFLTKNQNRSFLR